MAWRQSRSRSKWLFIEFAGFIISTGFCGARFGFVMTGGGDEVAVTRMNVEVIKAWVAGEGIGQFKAHAAADLAKDFIDQLEAALALEAFENGGDEDSCIELVGELLKEVAPALEDAKTATDTGFETEGVIERRAAEAVFRGVEKLKKRLEEFRSDDSLTMGRSGKQFYLADRQQAEMRDIAVCFDRSRAGE